MSSNDWDLFKEDLRSRCDIADIVGAYVPLKRAGPTLKGLCPFHKERSPSFNVDPRRQMYHCFGCGAGGDVFAFIQAVEKTDFMGAIELLARKTGLEDRIPRGAGAGGSGEARGEREKLFEIHSQLAGYYHDLLKKSPEAEPARAYLRERQLDDAAVKAWRIGYAPNRFDAILRWGKEKGYDLKLLVTAGVVATRDEDSARAGEPYDRFRGRVMFPICDATGRVIAFSGRILDANASPAKYMNSPETPIFKKSMVLFALDKAREHWMTTRQALLCEGQIDTIRCHLGGFPNAVAAQGTALTEEHIRLMKRYGVDEVILVPDADTAGQRSARKGLDLVLRGGMIPRVAVLTDDDDPDTLILREGPEAMRAALQGALSAVEYAFQGLAATEDMASAAGRMRVSRGLAALIRQATSEVLREQMTREAAQRLGVSPESLARDSAAVAAPESIEYAPEETAPPDTPPPPPQATGNPGDGVDGTLLLELVIHHPSLIQEFAWLLESLHLSLPGQGMVLKTLLAFRPDQHPDWHHYLPENEPQARTLAASLIMHARRLGSEFGDPRLAIGDAFMALCRRKLEFLRNRKQAEAPNTPEALRPALDMEIGQLNLAISTLKRAHLRHKWEEALPVLETFAGDF